MQKIRLTISALFILVLTVAELNVQAQNPPTQKDIPVSKQKLLAIKTIGEIVEIPKDNEMKRYTISFYGKGIAYSEQDYEGNNVTQKLTEMFRKMPVGTRMTINGVEINHNNPGHVIMLSPIPYVITE